MIGACSAVSVTSTEGNSAAVGRAGSESGMRTSVEGNGGGAGEFDGRGTSGVVLDPDVVKG